MSSRDRKARRAALRDFLIALPAGLDRAIASLGWLVVLGAAALGALVLFLLVGHHPPPPIARGDNLSGALYVRDLGRVSDGRHTFDLVYELVSRNEPGDVGIRDQLAIGDPIGGGDVIELGHAPKVFAASATKTFGVIWRVAIQRAADSDVLHGNWRPGGWQSHAAHFRINARPDQFADVAIGYTFQPQPHRWFGAHGRTQTDSHDEEVQLGAVLRAHCPLGVKVQAGEMKSLCGS